MTGQESPAPALDKRPRQFAGTIIIEWPQPRSGVLNGWAISLIDELTGKPIHTVTSFKVHLHADAENVVWADLEMFATPDGKPAYEAPAMGPPVLATFPFLVAEMRVADG